MRHGGQRVGALIWAVRSLWSARTQLRHGAAAVSLPLPAASVAHSRWVWTVVRRAPVTCLAQSFVMQRWLQAVGDPRDVVVGVTRPSDGFKAHAWVDGDPEGSQFQELRRIAPPA